MAVEITMPKLGLTMEEGTINRWFIKEADHIMAGEMLLTVETDKVAIDVESPVSGTLLKILVKEGVAVPISTIIAYIGEPGEILPVINKPNAQSINQVPEKEKRSDKGGPSVRSTGQKPVSISPIAHKLAIENKIDFSSIIGTGPGGRIVEEDIKKILEHGNKDNEDNKGIPFISEKLTPIKKLLAQRMSESFQQAPHFYLHKQIIVEKMKGLYEKINNQNSDEKVVKVTFTDFIIKALSKALETHPYLNASWSDIGIQLYQVVNLGFAIAASQGLIVAVIKDANKKSLIEIATERNILVEKAKSNLLNQDNISDGTFTLTNLGMYGIDDFSPILNPPQSGILAVGSIAERPLAENHKIVLREVMNVTLAADHRVVDGVQAADFLSHFAKLISENPENLL